MNLKISRIVVLASALLVAGAGRVLGQACPNLQEAVPQDLTSFLGAVVPDDHNADCVTLAIRRIGEARDPQTIPLLVKLLDFRRPLNEREKQGLYLRVQTIFEIYPAAAALCEIGKKAVPAVLAVVEAESTTAVARDNAVAVLMELHKYDKPRGIAVLREELEKSNDSAAQRRLRWAISQALRVWCSESDSKACEAAANPPS